MKGVGIEKAILRDISEIEKIFQKCYVEEYKTQYPKMSSKKILDMIKDSKLRIQNFKRGVHGKDYLLLVAKHENKIIGFAQANLKDSDKSIGLLNKLYILKNYRKKGIGSELTQKCLVWLKGKKVKEIEYYTLVNNLASIKNSQKHGFEKYVYMMRKKLK